MIEETEQINGVLEKAQDEFIEYISRLCDSFGLNHFVAQLYALLYLNGDKEMSLDEITERLKVSKGNVSINIRILENWGVVSKVWVKGSRKDYYKANPDIEKVFFGKIRSSIRKRLDEVSGMIEGFKNTIESGQGNFTPQDKEKAKIYLDRVKKIERLKNTAAKFITLADTIFPSK